ncbi:hypothetical protein ACFYWY_08595 [Streptomyces sp. NPDC002870]|uniref:hypothetical protein n=1 Tax=Streptomyces sp. NPDC002870 TaxID=3364666 RepID=UPI00367918E9
MAVRVVAASCAAAGVWRHCHQPGRRLVASTGTDRQDGVFGYDLRLGSHPT